MCARSLTCKSHSMGAKRSVPGRSLPYDMLLAAYQKKNQAKQQKAAIDANAPLEDEEANLGPIDSDEELNAVMLGLGNWNPQPLVVEGVVGVMGGMERIDKLYKRERLREQLTQATNGFTVDIFKVRGFGGAEDGRPGAEFRRARRRGGSERLSRCGWGWDGLGCEAAERVYDADSDAWRRAEEAK